MNQIINSESNVLPFPELILKELNRVKLKVHDIMDREEIMLFWDDSVRVARNVMEWEGLSHGCVFDHSHKLVGVVNYAEIKSIENGEKKIGYFMKENFQKIYGMIDAEVGKNRVMREKDHCMPVFENRKVVGILSAEGFKERYKVKGLDDNWETLCDDLHK